MKQIFFYNNTDVPIMVDYWINEILVENIGCFQTIKIHPSEKRMIYNSSGEWILHSDFFNLDDIIKWEKKKFNLSNPIGKISYKPNFEGFINNDIFCVNLREWIENGKKYDFITFSYKKVKID
jgi:hypothetical protein